MFDAIILGGGPAGSTCARVLTAAGARVAIVDREPFPRVKLCAGWLSPRFWDAIEVAPRDYPGGLWEWQTCHVRFRNTDHALACHGWFIRRFELDDFLLRRSGAELHLGVDVRRVQRDADRVWDIAGLRSRTLIGAAGTHCPVARWLAPVRRRDPVGVQELELQAEPAAIASTRVSGDGEPELLLFDDGAGYGWNVPKLGWINLGCGTSDPGGVRAAWRATHDYLRTAGHVPPEIEPALAHMKGHSYYLYDPGHLDRAAAVDLDRLGGAFLIGDALGLAHPITGEGIVPAVVSARLLGEAIVNRRPETYVAQLRREPMFADYGRLSRLLDAARAAKARAAKAKAAPGRSSVGGGRTGRALAAIGTRVAPRAFAWMFSGAQLPAPWLVDALLRLSPSASPAAVRS